MTILVTVSVNLAESVTVHDIRKFLEMAEQSGADPDVDLREYDENNDLVGLASVGELGSSKREAEATEEGGGGEETPSSDGSC